MDSDPHEAIKGHIDAWLLYDLMAGELDEHEAAAWRAHIASCNQCRELELALGPVIKRLRGMAVAAGNSLKGSLAEELKVALAAERRKATRTSGKYVRLHRAPTRMSWVPFLAAAAAVALGIGLGLAVGRREGMQRKAPGLAEKERPSPVEESRRVEVPVRAIPDSIAHQVGPARSLSDETTQEGTSFDLQAMQPPPGLQVSHEPTTESSEEPDARFALGHRRETRDFEFDSSEVHLGWLERVEGFATYARGDTDQWQPVREGMQLLPGDRLNTGVGRLEIALEGGGTAILGQATVVKLLMARGPAGGEIVLDVAKGRLCVDESGARVCVASPHGFVRPIGTLFSTNVTVAATTLAVADGVVEFRARKGFSNWLSSKDYSGRATLETIEWAGEPVRVEAGQSSAARVGIGVSAPAAADVEDAFGWAFGRVSRGIQALYLFKEGLGNLVRDVSGVAAPLDLTIKEPSGVKWLRGGGLLISAPVTISSRGPATKIIEACRASGELSVEVLARTVDATAEPPVRIVSISKDPFCRNFSLGVNGPGQPYGSYGVRLRTTVTTDNGTLGDIHAPPVLATAGGVVGTGLEHVVFTRDSNGMTRLYVNAKELARGSVGGSLANWDANFPLILANELTGGRHWLGELRLVAIYSRALKAREVWRNYRSATLSSAVAGRR